MRFRLRWALCLCVFALPVGATTPVQRQSSPPQTQPPDPMSPPIVNADDARARLSIEMAKKAAKERLVVLKHNTDKLLKLSAELKQSVDKSDENVLSLDVIKKAEEIEKLARSIKENMKGPN